MNGDKTIPGLTPEEVEELDEISALDNYELQGYLSAPYILKISNRTPGKQCNTPENLIYAILQYGNPSGDKTHMQRDLGIIRWCLDQRSRGKLKVMK